MQIWSVRLVKMLRINNGSHTRGMRPFAMILILKGVERWKENGYETEMRRK